MSDPDWLFMKTYAKKAVNSLRVGQHFARASDSRKPANYTLTTGYDLAFVVEHTWHLLDKASQKAAVLNAKLLLERNNTTSPVELPSFLWLLSSLSGHMEDGYLFCTYVDDVWSKLARLYKRSFRDGLLYFPLPSTGAFDTVFSQGHDLFMSVWHVQSLKSALSSAKRWGCGDRSAMRKIENMIVAALDGPILWNETCGMFRPSSEINTNLTDVWGSALAVELGVVTKERTGRIVEWFEENWESVVQKGQIRHLPLGQYWPSHNMWEVDTYQNGGYWGTPSGWVLPVIGRANRSLAEQLVRDAISDARESGLNEWVHYGFCCNCKGTADFWASCGTPYPSSGSFSGAKGFGQSVASIYHAAQLLISTNVTTSPKSRGLHDLTSDLTAITPTNSDSDLAWLTSYAQSYLKDSIVCGNCTSCDPFTGATSLRPQIPTSLLLTH